MTSKQPISSVTWVHRDRLTPNDYNPNMQASPEHYLLKVSILEDGWTQPIVVFEEGGTLHIVDGEHRWKVSGTPEVYALTDGLVPVVRVDKERGNRMMSTIRHNRARGSHEVMAMADIIEELLVTNTVHEVCKMLGMEDEEVYRLAESRGLPVQVHSKTTSFSPAWIPVDKD